MTFKRISPLMKPFALFLVIMDITLFASCQSDDFSGRMTLPSDGINFDVSIKETSKLKMRSLDSVYITSNPYSVDFYIELNCDSNDNGDIKHISQIKKYRVPPGYEGRLAPKTNKDTLKWHDLTSEHTFYAWTLPWYDLYKDEGEYKNDPHYEEPYSSGEIKIQFHNSSESEGYSKWKNDSILEYFLGAKSDAFSYVNHGKYVKLVFKHLVSKIKIGTMSVVKTDGSYQNHLKADITFIGMPNEATFYPHPEDGKAPYVEPGKSDENSGTTYFINNDPDDPNATQTIFYVCPELDFSKLGFKINLNSTEYGIYGDYYGSFEEVEFIREETDYDATGGGDEKILHAGEMMTLNIVLIPGQGPGISVVIKDWSTEEPTENIHHSHPGIYTDGEIKALIDIFLNQNPYNYEDYESIREELERLIELYGIEKNSDGKYVFPLYDNVTINSNILPIWKGCIIDGMGHTITIKTNKGVFGNNPYYNLGPVRDVYLTDPDGNNTIYIDSEGYVWTTDPENPGNYINSGYQLPELTPPYKSYDIDSVTGEIKLSDYYH